MSLLHLHDHDHRRPPTVLNRVFAGSYNVLMFPLEKSFMSRERRRLVSTVSGNVLEIGAGTGANFPFYPAGCRVLAAEPDGTMLQKARLSLKRGVAKGKIQAGIQLCDDPVEDLSCADNSMDYIVSTLVFCSVENLARAMKEMRRVLKPGGTILLFEHVKATQPWLQSLFKSLNPVWTPTMGGCRLGQDTIQVFKDAGFQVHQENMSLGFLSRFTAVQP